MVDVIAIPSRTARLKATSVPIPMVKKRKVRRTEEIEKRAIRAKNRSSRNLALCVSTW